MTAKTPSATLTRLACTPRQACTLGDRTTDAPDSSIVPEPLCEGVDLQAGACISDAGTADGHAAPAGARSDCVVSCIDDALASLKQARERAAARLGGAAHRTVRVLVFGPHDIRREGLVRLLGDTDGIEIIGVAGTEDEAIVLVTSARPDVVLLDLARPDIDGPEVVRRLLVARDELRIVMLTNTADEGRVRAAIEAGVIGYLLDDVIGEELAEAIVQAAVGRPTLHPTVRNHLFTIVAPPPPPPPPLALPDRDRAIMRLLALGSSNQAIAEALGFTHGTVKVYVSALLARLGVADRTQAALIAARAGLDAPESTGPSAIHPS